MSTAHSAWNPGLDSEIPSEIRDLCTQVQCEAEGIAFTPLVTAPDLGFDYEG